MSLADPLANEANRPRGFAAADDTLTVGSTPGSGWPLLISPRAQGASMQALAPGLRRIAGQQLETSGALLFRGLPLDGVEAFQSLAASFGSPLLGYDFGSTPRTRVAQGIYTSTEYPAHQHIPLHNEQSYSRDWPMRIWFYCAVPAPKGGETPIADSRVIYRRIDPNLRQRFEDRGLMYVRNFGNGLDVPWPKVFNTDRRSEVESYCDDHGISCEWKADGELRTRQVCQASARHPRTSEMVWFNQAHLFHISALDAEARAVLFELVPEEDLPRNVYYGDGSAIEETALDEIRGVLAETRTVFRWEAGDVLMLDNMLTAHGRTPFEGPRKVVVAMAEAHGAPQRTLQTG